MKVLGAVVSATLFLLPFKVAAREGRGAGAALGLLAFVVLLFFPWAIRRWPAVPADKRRGTLSLSWKLGVAAALGNVAQGYAFETLHAGVAATFIQMNVLFVAVLGLVWLKESLSGATVAGVLLAVAGIFTAQWPAIFGEFAWTWGVSWAVAGAFCFSLMDLFARRHGKNIEPVTANVLRSIVAVAMLAMVPGAVSQLTSMSPHELGACALAALLGPGIARQLLISAARDLPAVESALLQQLRPLLALPLVSLVFGTWPSVWEWGGCALLSLGVALPLALGVLRRSPSNLAAPD